MMRLKGSVLSGLAVAALMAGSSVMAAPVIGEPAPAFEVTGSDGETWSLEGLEGKTVVLEWTNHECPFVVKHYGPENMQSLQQEAADNDVVWLSVISSAPGKQGHLSAEQANALSAQRNASPATVLLDESGDMGRAYGARTTPQMAVIDAEGILRYMGGIDSIPSADPADIERADAYFANAMAAVLNGHDPDPAVSTPYGCSVKY